ncbi:MAG TPA: hypothetical protein VG328_00125, partial [Stellaceae bacterium]|nr:hypothetical protein [Stellaceae bacterium]
LPEGTKNMAWKPISEADLWDKINLAETKMSVAQRRFWNAIRILPEKWAQHPYGDEGGGFWVVAIIGRVTIWFNDIEGGFNRSTYRRYGLIEEYFSNQDELELSVQHVLTATEIGDDVGGKCGPPQPIS